MSCVILSSEGCLSLVSFLGLRFESLVLLNGSDDLSLLLSLLMCVLLIGTEKEEAGVRLEMWCCVD